MRGKWVCGVRPVVQVDEDGAWHWRLFIGKRCISEGDGVAYGQARLARRKGREAAEHIESIRVSNTQGHQPPRNPCLPT